MKTIKIVAYRLWLVATVAGICVASAYAVATKDLVARVPDVSRTLPADAKFEKIGAASPEQFSKSSCVPGTMTSTITFPNAYENLIPGQEKVDLFTEFSCSSWQRLGWWAVLSLAISIFVAFVGAGLIWAGAAFRAESRA